MHFFPISQTIFYSSFGICAVLTFISSFKFSLRLDKNALIAALQTNLATELFTEIEGNSITLYHVDNLKRQPELELFLIKKYQLFTALTHPGGEKKVKEEPLRVMDECP